MAQLSLFTPAEKPSARTTTKSTQPTQPAKPAKPAKAISPLPQTAFRPRPAFRTALAGAQKEAAAQALPPPTINPQSTHTTSASAAPYGVCHRCARPLSIPGLDTCYCPACGWISRPQNQWAGGRS